MPTIDIKCIVDVGTHTNPYWLEKNKNMIVCARHRMQYEERVDEFGPYNWENIPQCLVCNGFESENWWKCCPAHTTAEGIELVGDCCIRALHPVKLELMED